jgi:hypothetical protein
MILLVHLLFGALIGLYIKNPILAVILAFLSHYFLDFIPHNEYSISRVRSKSWKEACLDLLKIILDFSIGFLFILLLLNGRPIIFFTAFFSILPDGFSVLSMLFPNKLFDLHNKFHRKKIHYFKYKKISNFWRIFNQTIIVVISIFALI